MTILFSDTRNGFEYKDPYITIAVFLSVDIEDIFKAEEATYTRSSGGNFRKINEYLGKRSGIVLYSGKESEINIDDYNIDEIYLLKLGNY